jgi:hypothetical protein
MFAKIFGVVLAKPPFVKRWSEAASEETFVGCGGAELCVKQDRLA